MAYNLHTLVCIIALMAPSLESYSYSQYYGSPYSSQSFYNRRWPLAVERRSSERLVPVDDALYYPGPKVVKRNNSPVLKREDNKAKNTTSGADNLVFPGPTSKPQETSFVPNISKQCQEMEVCEEVSNYPAEYINNIINKWDVRQSEDKFEPEIEQRRRGPEEIELCYSVKKPIAPQALQNIYGEWFFIVNRPSESAVQTLYIERCSGNTKCNTIAKFPNNYTSYCQQKHLSIPILALSKTGQIHIGLFKVPSGCVCVVKPDSL